MPYLAKLVGAALVAAAALAAAQPAPGSQQAQKLMQDGNYQEALEQFRQLTLEGTGGEAAALIANFRGALNCYQQLNRVHEIDAYREAVVEKYADRWELVADAAQSWLDIPHYGYLIAGEFRRGDHRGGGEIMHATARDRVRAMQLFRQAQEQVDSDADERSDYAYSLCTNFAAAVLHGGGAFDAWRLQSLTDLDELPDYEPGWGYYGRETRGAPVDAEGNPIYYERPESWDAAKNDGERWRWILATRTSWRPSSRPQELRDRADFLQTQFGVRTMANYGWWFARQTDEVGHAQHVRPAHPGRGRNDRPAGHGDQAVQVAGRAQPDRALQADRRGRSVGQRRMAGCAHSARQRV
jgi:hypothetical protein